MVSHNFECADDPPRNDCPIETGEGELVQNSNGERVCPFCYCSFGFPLGYAEPGDADYYGDDFS